MASPDSTSIAWQTSLYNNLKSSKGASTLAGFNFDKSVISFHTIPNVVLKDQTEWISGGRKISLLLHEPHAGYSMGIFECFG